MPPSDGRSALSFDVSPAAAVFYPLLYFFDDGGWFAAVLPAVLFHELGHYAAVRLCGERVYALTVSVTGLVMDVSPLSDTKAEIFCAAAGPCLGLCWWFLAQWIGGAWGEKSAAAALLINVFNLLPAMPLDGGRILYALSDSRRLTACVSALTAAALFFIAVIGRSWLMLLPTALIAADLFRA